MWMLILLLPPILLFAAVCVCAKVRRTERKCDCIIVLGAKVHPDGSMSRSLRYRCDAAAAAWKKGKADTIIACGGRVGNVPFAEAALMRAYLEKLGVPPEKVLLEDQSRNTVENLKYAREIMAQHGFHFAAIVTSDYHVQRAIWIARKFSIRACGVPAKSPQKFHHRMKSLLRECVSWVIFWYYELKLRKGTPSP